MVSLTTDAITIFPSPLTCSFICSLIFFDKFFLVEVLNEPEPALPAQKPSAAIISDASLIASSTSLTVFLFHEPARFLRVISSLNFFFSLPQPLHGPYPLWELTSS